MIDLPAQVPAFLRIPKEDRAAAWTANPPRPMPFIQTERREATPEYEAVRAEFEERRRLKSLAKVARMKQRFEAKAIDHSRMRWDQRRGKFVEDLFTRPALRAETGQDVKHKVVCGGRGSGKSGAVRQVINRAGQSGNDIDWSRVNKDTARALAELNGVWDDKYTKLSGGLLVMTVTNRLKGIVKKGGNDTLDLTYVPPCALLGGLT